MRRRILKTTIASLVAMALLLGVPLAVVIWAWISASAHGELADRLKTMSEYVLAQEAAGRVAGPQELDLEEFRLLIPAHGTLSLTGPNGTSTVGDPLPAARLSESVSLGSGYALTLSVPRSESRPSQWVAVGVLGAVMVGAVLGGVLIALVTVRRLTEPLSHVASRAEAMGRGDLSTSWPRYDIDELDRVSAALSDANAEIARRLEREGQIIGDVSHQLRSRLTAIGLRLDELTMHDDPDVVDEAAAGVAQVEQLAHELDELVAVSRAEGDMRTDIDVEQKVAGIVAAYRAQFAAAGRTISVAPGPSPRHVAATRGRLREALSALIDNALHHGGGAVTIRLEDIGSADMVRITVADQGAGVPDAIASEIFRRGFSAGSSSGVGLSLARALVEADGGRLDLVSRRPAAFAVVIPAVRDPRTAGEDPPVLRSPDR